jgi:CheY-like chemotaxis protein
VAESILVVDDEPDMVLTCAQILTGHGYRCLTASAGSEAMAMIDAEHPDLVVTDLHMPGIDGLAVARHARQRVPPIPVVLVTVWPPARGAQDEPPATARLAKPFANADLVATVRCALRVRPRRNVVGTTRPTPPREPGPDSGG